jgi:hypothetical protein
MKALWKHLPESVNPGTYTTSNFEKGTSIFVMKVGDELNQCSESKSVSVVFFIIA